MQSVVTTDLFDALPRQVRTVRVLGHGRAAQARLVEATMADGETVVCVEKVFCPGLLTRTLYRLSFQSPFAYQSNRAAIAACFYRRRVAAAVLAMTGTGARVAMPMYVRFDEPTRAWVLAAQWCRGRGIRPEPAQPQRFAKWFSWLSTKPSPVDAPELAPRGPSEIEQLVATMDVLESALIESGLTGSGWQVAPRAMVSTANLLRVRNDDGNGHHYTVIDLESGIPAVLVPKYLRIGATRGALPPFDDLDADRLRTWMIANEVGLVQTLGSERHTQLMSDVESLIHWTDQWKSTELAFFRWPATLFSSHRRSAYVAECRRRWKQDGITDEAHGATFAGVWLAGLIPTAVGRFAAKCVGSADHRTVVKTWLENKEVRDQTWTRWINDGQAKLRGEKRIAKSRSLSRTGFVAHSMMSKVSPAPVHRLVTDRAALSKAISIASR